MAIAFNVLAMLVLFYAMLHDEHTVPLGHYVVYCVAFVVNAIAFLVGVA